MRKVLSSLVLFGVIATVVAVANMSSAPALQKDKKDAKEEIGTIEVYQAKDGWRFRIKNAEDKSVAIGTVGFDKKEDCLKTVEFIKNTLAKAKVTEIKSDKKDK